MNNSSFQADYEAYVVDRPGSGQVEFVFDDGHPHSKATTVAFAPNEGERWLASFATDYALSSRAVSGIFPSPNPRHTCILENGVAFLVDVSQPGVARIVDAGPVVEVRSAPEQRLLLLVTPWKVSAIGERGLLWETLRISADEVRIDEVQDGWIRGVADPEVEAQPFLIRSADGELLGGTTIPE